jgi:hypothetical protein
VLFRFVREGIGISQKLSAIVTHTPAGHGDAHPRTRASPELIDRPRERSQEMEETSTLPRSPIPEIKILFRHGGSSVEKESLSTPEDADLFLSLVILEPEDASTVHEPETFPLWYDIEVYKYLPSAAGRFTLLGPVSSSRL